MMMKTVKHTLSSIGDHGGELVTTVGAGTAGLARRLGGGTAGLAKRIGPRHALIGIAVAAAAIGGSIVVVRYLRARRAAAGPRIGDAAGPVTGAGPLDRSHGRPADGHAPH
jgi:hypothetical protein